MALSGAIAVWVLLAIGMAAFLLTALGLLVFKDLYDRIQYTYPAGTIGVAALVAAILVQKSLSQAGLKAILVGVILFWSSAALSHAIARSARVRRLGDWGPADGEKIETIGD